jgi:hypothetical protein
MNFNDDRFRLASATSMRNMDSSNTDFSSNRSSSQQLRAPVKSHFNQPRLYGPITSQMIDEFLNPKSYMKDPQNRFMVDLKLASVTGGRGIVQRPSKFNETMQVTSQNLLSILFDIHVIGK